MRQIDTLSLLVFPFASMLFACGGATTGNADPHADPTNPSQEQGREGEDPGWSEASLNHHSVATTARLRSKGGRGLTSAKSLGSSGDRSSSFLGEAQRELDSLDIGSSYYSHTTYMNESSGTRRTDCSGWMDYILRTTLSDAYILVPHPNTFKPLANDWVSFLSAQPTTPNPSDTARFRQITQISDLQPGDLIAWLTPPDSSSNNTGHMMMVADWPSAGRSGETLVPVLDSTSSPHASDSRGYDHTGLGT
ncbi:MAG: hypothetical protein NVS3B20_17250 [Polyangiales bacterium]